MPAEPAEAQVRPGTKGAATPLAAPADHTVGETALTHGVTLEDAGKSREVVVLPDQVIDIPGRGIGRADRVIGLPGWGITLRDQVVGLRDQAVGLADRDSGLRDLGRRPPG
ncbi:MULTISPECIES: hypothetical protein [unclassified Streptomyces]|uniref:hypothetical protein n=1 Tax=unclassified Streptomyces TaxID=2593676 RepID=UPI001CB701BE|nr:MULTISPECIES: hypothetical protein [unclassified Streptomyces]